MLQDKPKEDGLLITNCFRPNMLEVIYIGSIQMCTSGITLPLTHCVVQAGLMPLHVTLFNPLY